MRAEIAARLALRSPEGVEARFDRAEIAYRVFYKDAMPRGQDAYAHLLSELRSTQASPLAGCGIVYCATREATASLATQLASDGARG